MFNVKMERMCYFCGAPTIVLVTFEDEFTDKAFMVWEILFKKDFSQNVHYYKKVGSVVRHSCKYCYLNPPTFNTRNREITGKVFRVKSKSLSVQELFLWFDSFKDNVQKIKNGV